MQIYQAKHSGLWTTAAVVMVLGNTIPASAHEPGPATTPVQPGKKLPRYATVVESRRPPLLASQRVIDARELSVAPRRRSADDLLRLVPGVLLSQHGSEGKGQQIFLRGFDAVHGQDVEVTVAGIPINELSNIHGQGYIDLNFVIPEVVRQVSASKGPFLLNQGNFANAGTIRFDLGVDPASRGTRTSYEFGSTLRHRGVVVHAPKQLRRESFVAFEAMHDRGFAASRKASRASSIGQVRLVDSKEYGHLDLFGAGYYATFSSPGAVTASDVADGAVPFAGAYQTDWGGSSIRGIASLRHEIDIGRGKLDQRLYGQVRRFDILENFTGYLQDSARGDRRLQTHDFLSAGYQIEYTRPIVDSLVFVAGGAWQGDRVAQRDEQVDANHGVISKNWDLGVAQNQAHARTGLRWRPSGWFYTEGGARVDMFAYDVIDHVRDDARTKKVLARVSPRLLTAFRISERWSLFASYGRGFRAPEARSILGGKVTPSDLELNRYKGGTPRIFPSDSVEVGGRFTGRKYFYAGLALFGTWVDRELVFDHVSAVNLELNKTRVNADRDPRNSTGEDPREDSQ